MASRTYRRRTAGVIKGLLQVKGLHLAAWIIWFLTLWYLSSGSLPEEPTPDFPFKDKVMHWGYFGIGGALLAFYTLASSNTGTIRSLVFCALLILGILVGALDEWHQSWSIHRSGNDLGDLLADTAGTLSGLLCAPYVWRRIFA